MQNERQLPVESLPNREFLRKEFLNFGHCLSSNVAAWNLGTQMRRRRYTMKYYECNLLSSVRHQENPVKSNQKKEESGIPETEIALKWSVAGVEFRPMSRFMATDRIQCLVMCPGHWEEFYFPCQGDAEGWKSIQNRFPEYSL